MRLLRGVSRLGIIGVLSVLLVLSIVGCDEAEPNTPVDLPVPTLAPAETAEPRPAPIFWRVVASEDLSATTPSANIRIHDIVVSPKHITVLYSIDLLNADSQDLEVTVGHGSTLISSNGVVHEATTAQRLATFRGSTLAAITFEPYKLGGRELNLQVPELIISNPGASQTSQIDEPIELHILTRLIPDDSSSAITRFSGLDTSLSGAITAGIPGSFVGSSPRGQVASVGYRIDGVEKWFLVDSDGHIEELSKQTSYDILEHLGITAPTPIDAPNKSTLEEPDAQDQQMLTSTSTPSPRLPRPITPTPGIVTFKKPAFESYRLDLGPDLVAAFVEGLTPEMSEKVAYVTHVPSGTQAILGRNGKVIHRHDGREDGPSHLDAILGDGDAIARIMEGLNNGEDVRPRENTVTWVHSLQFSDIFYTARWRIAFGPESISRENDLTEEDLGPDLYRIAFRGDGYVGLFYRYQDGDATYLNPGTAVYAVKGYSQEFRLATLKDGEVTLFEADTNPQAKIGEDLLDIRDKVTAVNIYGIKDKGTVLATIDEERNVKSFVEKVLESPVDQENRHREGERYFIEFRLADGTLVRRLFWPESGELSRGIMTDPMVASIVSSALLNN